MVGRDYLITRKEPQTMEQTSLPIITADPSRWTLSLLALNTDGRALDAKQVLVKHSASTRGAVETAHELLDAHTEDGDALRFTGPRERETSPSTNHLTIIRKDGSRGDYCVEFIPPSSELGLTIAQQLHLALLMTGWAEVSSPSKKFRKFTKDNTETQWVGKAGALKTGPTSSMSRPCSENYKRTLLASFRNLTPTEQSMAETLLHGVLPHYGCPDCKEQLGPWACYSHSGLEDRRGHEPQGYVDRARCNECWSTGRASGNSDACAACAQFPHRNRQRAIEAIKGQGRIEPKDVKAGAECVATCSKCGETLHGIRRFTAPIEDRTSTQTLYGGTNARNAEGRLVGQLHLYCGTCDLYNPVTSYTQPADDDAEDCACISHEVEYWVIQARKGTPIKGMLSGETAVVMGPSTLEEIGEAYFDIDAEQ